MYSHPNQAPSQRPTLRLELWIALVSLVLPLIEQILSSFVIWSGDDIVRL